MLPLETTFARKLLIYYNCIVFIGLLRELFSSPIHRYCTYYNVSLLWNVLKNKCKIYEKNILIYLGSKFFFFYTQNCTYIMWLMIRCLEWSNPVSGREGGTGDRSNRQPTGQETKRSCLQEFSERHQVGSNRFTGR